MEATRQRLRRVAQERLATELATARSDGDVAKVHERAALLYQVDPLSDAAAQALAERQLLGGDRVGAIQLLRRHARRTQTDVGCQASAEILSRLRQLERGRGEGGADCSTAEPARLIARESEVARLEALWSGMAPRGLLTCVVTGPAGIGKSTLVRCFAASVASRGWPVFSVACQEIGRTIPFAAVSDFIYALAADPAISGTDPVWLSEVSRVTPGIKSLYPGVPDPPPVPAESVRIRVAESISRVLEVLADGGPTLLVFDDVQNMDPATRDVLHVLLRRLEATPTFLLATLRTTDSRSFRFAASPSSSGLVWQHTVPLIPFTAVQAEAFLATRLSASGPIDPVILDKVIELAGGNPYLLEMLLMDWQRDGARSLVMAEVEGDGTDARWRPPDTMRKAFERQYRGLSSTAQRFLAVLAVAGKKISPAEIGELAALTGREIDLAAVEVLDRGIVRVDGTSFGFKNEMHRAFVYFALLSEDSRKYHHARLAKVLESRSDERDFQQALEASHHSLRAGMPETAVVQVIKGAEMAISMGGPREAERALSAVINAMEDTLSPELRLLLARSFNAQGKHTSALAELAEIEPSQLQPRDAAAFEIVRTNALRRGRLVGDHQLSRAAKRAAELAAQVGDERLVLEALQLRAEVASDQMDLSTIQDTAIRTRRIATSTTDEVRRGHALVTRAFCLMVSGDYLNAIKTFNEAKTILSIRSREIEVRRIHNGLGICFTNVGRFTEATDAFHKAIELARNTGNAAAECVSWDNLGALYEDLGQFHRAANAYQQAWEALDRAPTPKLTAVILTNAASLDTSLGNLAEAALLLDKADAAARVHEGDSMLLLVRMGQADLDLAVGEYERAWDLFREVLELTRGKTLLNGAIGQYGRLHRQYIWATQGYTAMAGSPKNSRAVGLGNTLARRLETEAFEAWAREKEYGSPADTTAIKRLLGHDLLGVVARLLALHICPVFGKAYERTHCSSPASWVSQHIATAEPSDIPTSVLQIAP